MSFSSTIKEELSRHIGTARHCRIAEIAAIINVSGQIEFNEISNRYGIKVHTENPTVARKYFTLLKKTFNISVEVVIRRSKQLKKKRVYYVYVFKKDDVINVLRACHILRQSEIHNQIDPLLVATNCCRRSYIRGAFLASGSMSEPEKTYHLEIVDVHEWHCHELQKLINHFDMDSKIIMRKKYHVLYLKEGSQIVEFLNVVEAHVALMELENLRILKEMRNNVNRQVNCETANLNKTVSAAVNQINDIEYIDDCVGIDKLPIILQELALIRSEHSEASLKELGQMLSEPIGKSGVNHRLRKISEFAQQLRDSREE
jgi:cell division protein WhiA